MTTDPPKPAARPRRARREGRARWMPPVASALLMVAAIGYGLTLPSPGDASGYHDSILALQTEAPLTVGEWFGRDADVPQEATQLLDPNLILSRTYTNGRTRETAGVLLVQCKDSRDLNGHWPLNCYPASGATLESVEPDTWTVDGQTYPGVRYYFSEPRDGFLQQFVVANFLILPDGRVTPDMDVVINASGDYMIRYYGAAQVQIITDGGAPENRRREVIETFIVAYRPLLDALRSGVPAQHVAP